MKVRIMRVVAKEVESTDKECAASGGARCSLGRGAKGGRVTGKEGRYTPVELAVLQNRNEVK